MARASTRTIQVSTLLEVHVVPLQQLLKLISYDEGVRHSERRDRFRQLCEVDYMTVVSYYA